MARSAQRLWTSLYRLTTLVPRGFVGLAFKKIADRGFGRIRSIDTICINVHAHGANPGGGQKVRAMGRTKGELNTKLAMIVDALSRPCGDTTCAGQSA